MTKTSDKSAKSKKTAKTAAKPAAKGKSKGRGKATESAPRIQLTLDQKIDIVGVILIALGGLTILSMLSSRQADITGKWIGFLRDTFGLGFFVIPIVFLLLGLWLLLRSFEKTPRLTREQIAGLILLFVVALMSLAFFDRVAGRIDRHGPARRSGQRRGRKRFGRLADRRLDHRGGIAV